MSVEDHIRSWLARRNTGCWFVAKLATESKRNGLLLATFPGSTSPKELDAFFLLAGGQHLPAIAIFPNIRTEHELADQLLVFAVGERWRVRRVPVPEGLETDDVLVGIEWETADAGVRSSPMGFASLGTMPVTRRAPYTCIAAWTGGHENKHRKKIDPVVHFLDTDLGQYRLNPDRYKELRLKSERDTSDLLAGQNDKASHYRNVAFRLSATVSEQLAALPMAEG